MRSKHSTKTTTRRAAFTLVELLVVISIIALLIAILLPSLRRARSQAKATVCLTRLRTLGQGTAMYALDNSDALLPGRMPNMHDGVNWQLDVAGGLKYRPTFLAVMGHYVGVPAFDDPKAEKAMVDRYGEAGDRQNYSSDTYVCPAVTNWRDERNGCYGYNYQFLGNSRLQNEDDPFDFKNWPVNMSRVRTPGACVAIADCMGTAASYEAKQAYIDNARDADRYGNEGFNLDPPWVDAANGEMANWDAATQARTAADPRHNDRAVVFWLDGHCTRETLEDLGYQEDPNGVIPFEGNNRYFHPNGRNEPWLQRTAGTAQQES